MRWLMPRRRAAAALALLPLLLASAGCRAPSRPPPAWTVVPPWVGPGAAATLTPEATATLHPLQALMPPTRGPGEPFLTPTPDPGRPAPTFRTESELYTVRPGDSLGRIAARFGVGTQALLAANNLANPDLLYAGQILRIPAQSVRLQGPALKLLPDSELVYGPSTALFTTTSFVAERAGYLSRYSEQVEGSLLSGARIVQTVALRYSLNPRVLLSLLEHQSGWVTQTEVAPHTLTYPLGFVTLGYEGLYPQLAWAADQLNRGYYRWRSGWNGPYVLRDGAAVPPGTGINAATAGVQNALALLYPEAEWREAVGEAGWAQTHARLFGNPFDLAVEPLVPTGLQQPEMQLPFEPGAVWSFTSGPHGAYASGSAWAALDFGPPGDALGCVPSEAWVTAVADGLILRAEQGEVLLDLDGDGYEGTGWVVYFLHIETRDRVAAGTWVHAGDRIGHPSCEGGVSTGTHVHIARKYNGEWIAADSAMSFVMDGWVPAVSRFEYDGLLRRAGVVLEACACRSERNQIAR